MSLRLLCVRKAKMISRRIIIRIMSATILDASKLKMIKD